MPGRSRSAAQGDLFEIEAERSLLDQLIADVRLYTSTNEFQDLMDFVVRLRNFAPFNAMLLQFDRWRSPSPRPTL
jgi:hypothetical protein